jgi:glycosidase
LPNLKRLKFFEKDEIMWTGKYELQDFYKTLLDLHSTNPALRAGDEASTTVRLKTSDEEHVLAYLRKNGDNEVLVVLNFSKSDSGFNIDNVNGKFKEVFSGLERDLGDSKNFEMKGWEYYVFEKWR